FATPHLRAAPRGYKIPGGRSLDRAGAVTPLPPGLKKFAAPLAQRPPALPVRASIQRRSSSQIPACHFFSEVASQLTIREKGGEPWPAAALRMNFCPSAETSKFEAKELGLGCISKTATGHSATHPQSAPHSTPLTFYS